MSWIRMDDGFATHPKVLGLSDEAFRLHVSGLCYTAQHRLDGWIPDAFIQDHVDALHELRDAGLWEDDPSHGYHIHDFLVFNPSSADRRSRSESASQAATARWAKQTDSEALETPMQNGSKPHASRMQSVLGDGEGAVGVSPGGSGGVFDRFWSAYPRKRSKAGARKKFEVVLKSGVDPEEVIAGAERYRDDPNRDPEFTKDPTTWLNNGCWEDEPLPPRGGGRAGRGSNRHLAALADQVERGTA